MLGDADVVAFVASSNLTRSREFYAGTLGLPVVSEDEYACVFDAHGTTLRVAMVGEPVVAPYTVLGWTVGDLSAAMAGLIARGVTFLHFDGMGQDDAGVWAAPSGARVAWFNDPDGNVLSLTG